MPTAFMMPLTRIHDALIKKFLYTSSRVQSHVSRCGFDIWCLLKCATITPHRHREAFSLFCFISYKLGNVWIPNGFWPLFEGEGPLKLVQLTSRVRINVDYIVETFRRPARQQKNRSMFMYIFSTERAHINSAHSERIVRFVYLAWAQKPIELYFFLSWNFHYYSFYETSNAWRLRGNTEHKWTRVESETNQFENESFFGGFVYDFKSDIHGDCELWLFSKRAIEFFLYKIKGEYFSICIIFHMCTEFIMHYNVPFLFRNEANKLHFLYNLKHCMARLINYLVCNAKVRIMFCIRCLLITSIDDLRWFIDIDPNKKANLIS